VTDKLWRAVILNPDGSVFSHSRPYETSGPARSYVTRYTGGYTGRTGYVETTPERWANPDAPAPQAPLHEFSAWPKIPRLFRDITITEKIDGTNAAVAIRPVADIETADITGGGVVSVGGSYFAVYAQSRNRLITPGADNYGFAGWVWRNAAELVVALGAGLHFGEWWGQGIQRGYNANGKRFSLFNTDKHAALNATISGVPVRPVPVLYRGPFTTSAVEHELSTLRTLGSVAAPGFPTPEGVCVFHHASRQVFKATLDAQDAGKWEAAQ
jgi:hypothetical protein